MLLFLGLLAACVPQAKKPAAALSLDQGFETLFPDLSAELKRSFGESLPPDRASKASISILVASPFSAARILDPNSTVQPLAPPGQRPTPDPSSAAAPHWNGHIVVPFAEATVGSLSSVSSVRYDYEAAYADMGRAAAKALSKSRGSRSCAIVFQENFLRPSSALEAFSAAFSAASGAARGAATGAASGEGGLEVEKIQPDPKAVDPGGAVAAAIAKVSGKDVGVLVLAVDAKAQAEKAAEAAGKIYFVDASSWDAKEPLRARFAYRLEGDEKAVAAAVRKTVEGIVVGGAAAGASVLVPLRMKRPFLEIF